MAITEDAESDLERLERDAVGKLRNIDLLAGQIEQSLDFGFGNFERVNRDIAPLGEPPCMITFSPDTLDVLTRMISAQADYLGYIAYSRIESEEGL